MADILISAIHDVNNENCVITIWKENFFLCNCLLKSTFSSLFAYKYDILEEYFCSFLVCLYKLVFLCFTHCGKALLDMETCVSVDVLMMMLSPLCDGTVSN
jgi:hypothetical protein